MKNYLYKFEFISGFYENYFYQQVKEVNEKKAIIEIVSYFLNTSNDEANKYIGSELGLKWTVEKFWRNMDLKFFSKEGTECYNLISFREINFDLDRE